MWDVVKETLGEVPRYFRIFGSLVIRPHATLYHEVMSDDAQYRRAWVFFAISLLIAEFASPNFAEAGFWTALLQGSATRFLVVLVVAVLTFGVARCINPEIPFDMNFALCLYVLSVAMVSLHGVIIFSQFADAEVPCKWVGGEYGFDVCERIENPLQRWLDNNVVLLTVLFVLLTAVWTIYAWFSILRFGR